MRLLSTPDACGDPASTSACTFASVLNRKCGFDLRLQQPQPRFERFALELAALERRMRALDRRTNTSRCRTIAPSAIHGPNSSPSTISTMSPVICGGSWARCESTAIEIKCASSTPSGTAATTPTSCRIHRGNQSGSRSGRCSSRPNASMAARPTTTAWPIVTCGCRRIAAASYSARRTEPLRRARVARVASRARAPGRAVVAVPARRAWNVTIEAAPARVARIPRL